MADDFDIPKVQWRDISGAVLDENGKKLPPGLLPYSTSEGDMKKRVFRHSKYPAAFTQAVVNDDGTGIAAETDRLLKNMVGGLLQDIVSELQELKTLMQALLIEATEVSGKSKTAVPDERENEDGI